MAVRAQRPSSPPLFLVCVPLFLTLLSLLLVLFGLLNPFSLCDPVEWPLIWENRVFWKSTEVAMSPRLSQCALLLVFATLLVSGAWAQCTTLTELYSLTGTVQFQNTSGTGAFCVRIMPQPTSTAMEVKSIQLSIDPAYSITGADITAYSTWFPIEGTLYIVKTWTDCCDSQTTVIANSPIITLVFNTSYSSYPTTSVSFVAQTGSYRTKFSMGLFQGLIIAICLPILSLIISLCTFRKGVCNEAGKKRRLSRKTPMAERIATGIAAGIGMLFFFLLTFRVFG